VQSISVSKDQRHIYTGSKDGTLKVRRASAFHCSAGSDHLPTCQVWEPGSFETAVVEVKDAHVRHTGARAIPPFCDAWCPRFVTLGAALLAGAMGLFAGKDASLGISEVYQSDFNRQAISCGADGRVVLWKDL